MSKYRIVGKRKIVDTGKNLPRPTFVGRIFYTISREGIIKPVILKHIRSKGGLVHGARAMNIQMPRHYRRKTDDWDIYTNQAQRCAIQIEQELDGILGVNMFYVTIFPIKVGGETKLVHRVVSRADKKPVVDSVYEPDLPPHIVVGGVKYATLKYLRDKQEHILSNPKFRFRWGQARSDLDRINRAMEEISWRREMNELIAGLFK